MGADLKAIGWWIESADEAIYGPVSRATLQKFLETGVISANTIVRHCTSFEAGPVGAIPEIREGLQTGPQTLPTGDRLAENWPRKKKDRLALAEDEIPCTWKNRAAVLVCLRCGGPYCQKYQMKPFKKQFHFCAKCQKSLYNRRTVAYLFDTFVIFGLFMYVPMGIALVVLAGMQDNQTTETVLPLVLNGLFFAAALLFLFRDKLFAGAGPGKRLTGLRVVKTSDGVTPLGPGQAFLRWISLNIPIFNLADLMVPYRDVLMRRYGDRWAGTRVIDTDAKLQKTRTNVLIRLDQKGVQLDSPVTTPMSEFARIAG